MGNMRRGHPCVLRTGCRWRPQRISATWSYCLNMSYHNDIEGVPGYGDISLIETDSDSGGGSIMFVKWENDVPDRCRQVSVDRNGGIVWNMALGVERVPKNPVLHCPLETTTRLIDHVPATMARVRGRGRPDMPEWCLVIRRYYFTKHFSGPSTCASDDGCVVCRFAGLADGVADVVHRCYSCSCNFHRECAKKLGHTGMMGHSFQCRVCDRH